MRIIRWGAFLGAVLAILVLAVMWGVQGRPFWAPWSQLGLAQQQPATATPSLTSTPVTASTPTPVTQASGTAKFPTTPAEAAALFGGDVSRWEKNPDGGWHLREEATTTLVTPNGFLGEGYNDTKPGKNPDCYAFTVPIAVQGATLWPEPGTRDNAVKLQAKMAIPVWDDGKQHACRVLAP